MIIKKGFSDVRAARSPNSNLRLSNIDNNLEG